MEPSESPSRSPRSTGGLNHFSEPTPLAAFSRGVIYRCQGQGRWVYKESYGLDTLVTVALASHNYPTEVLGSSLSSSELVLDMAAYSGAIFEEDVQPTQFGRATRLTLIFSFNEHTVQNFENMLEFFSWGQHLQSLTIVFSMGPRLDGLGIDPNGTSESSTSSSSIVWCICNSWPRIKFSNEVLIDTDEIFYEIPGGSVQELQVDLQNAERDRQARTSGLGTFRRWWEV